MIGNYPDDYNFIDTTVFFDTSILYILIVGTIMSLVSITLEFFKLTKTNTFIIYFALSWIVISGFILPVAASTAMIDPIVNPTDWINLAIVFIISIIFAMLSLKVFKKYIQIFLFVIVFTSIISPSWYMYNYTTKKTVDNINHPSLQLSNKRNIFIISFDGMPGEDINKIIKNSEEYSNSFKDFTIFENAVSQSPKTVTSLMGDIFGVQDYKAKEEDYYKLKKILLEEGLTSLTTSNNIEDSYQSGYNGYNIKKIKVNNPIVEIFDKKASFEFFDYPIVRIFGSLGVKVIKKIDHLLSLYEYIFLANIPLEMINEVDKYTNNGWDMRSMSTLSLFDSFVSDITVADKNISLRYGHFLFTHYPVNIDENCNYRGKDLEWFRANQNEEGIKGSNLCGIKKFITFINKLKELNIYDKSLIIFKSDHGKPAPYFSTSPNNLRINKHVMWGYNRYRPTLIIKDFDTNNSEPIYKSELAVLTDIAKTICEKSTIHKECHRFNGINLFETSLEKDEPYYIYTPRDENGVSGYNHYISNKILTRKITLLKAMEDAKHIELDISPNKRVDDLNHFGGMK
jgi:hypothetical protein